MSPGIRSGVNCTRRVCTDSARREAAHQQGLGDARHALHQHVPAAEQRDEQAGHRGVLADDGLGRPRRGRRPAARARVARLGSAVLGLVSSVMCGVPLCRAREPVVARAIRSWSVAVGARVGAEQGVDLVDRRGRRAAATSRTSASRSARRGRRSRSASRARAARAQRLGGVAAVAGPAVEPAEAARGLDGLDRDRQRLGGERPEPAAAPRRSARRTASAEQPEAGASQPGSRLRAGRRRRRRPGRSSEGTYQTSRSSLAEQPQRHGGVVRRAAPGRWSAPPAAPSRVRPGRGLGDERRRPGRGSSRRVSYASAASTSQRQPVVRRAAGGRPAPSGARGRRRTTRRRAGAVSSGPGRDDDQPRVALVVEQPRGRASARGGRSTVTTTVVDGVERRRASSASARADDVDLDALVVEHPGQRLGARRRRGCRGSSGVGVRSRSPRPEPGRERRRRPAAATATRQRRRAVPRAGQLIGAPARASSSPSTALRLVAAWPAGRRSSDGVEEVGAPADARALLGVRRGQRAPRPRGRWRRAGRRAGRARPGARRAPGTPSTTASSWRPSASAASARRAELGGGDGLVGEHRGRAARGARRSRRSRESSQPARPTSSRPATSMVDERR